MLGEPRKSVKATTGWSRCCPYIAMTIAIVPCWDIPNHIAPNLPLPPNQIPRYKTTYLSPALSIQESLGSLSSPSQIHRRWSTSTCNPAQISVVRQCRSPTSQTWCLALMTMPQPTQARALQWWRLLSLSSIKTDCWFFSLLPQEYSSFDSQYNSYSSNTSFPQYIETQPQIINSIEFTDLTRPQMEDRRRRRSTTIHEKERVSNMHTVSSVPTPPAKPGWHRPFQRRRAQNRASQRAFRDRKEKHVLRLEHELEELENKHRTLARSYTDLGSTAAKLRQEVKQLHSELDIVKGSREGSVNNELSQQSQNFFDPFASDVFLGNGIDLAFWFLRYFLCLRFGICGFSTWVSSFLIPSLTFAVGSDDLSPSRVCGASNVFIPTRDCVYQISRDLISTMTHNLTSNPEKVT